MTGVNAAGSRALQFHIARCGTWPSAPASFEPGKNTRGGPKVTREKRRRATALARARCGCARCVALWASTTQACSELFCEACCPARGACGKACARDSAHGLLGLAAPGLVRGPCSEAAPLVLIPYTPQV